MARLVRVSPVGVPLHIVQCGNNRQICFGGEEDMKVYLNWLKEFSKKYNVDVHSLHVGTELLKEIRESVNCLGLVVMSLCF